MRYQVMHEYRAGTNGARAMRVLHEGEILELRLAEAEWLNRDSPGLLVPVDDPIDSEDD